MSTEQVLVRVVLEGPPCMCGSCSDESATSGSTSNRIGYVNVDDAMTDEHVARLLDQLEFLTAHPDRHDQNTWFKLGAGHRLPVDRDQDEAYLPVRAQVGSIDNCGSVACLAGWTVLRTESIPLVRDYQGDMWPGFQYDDGTWTSEDTGTAAARYLGLNHWNADTLFAGTNTIGDLWRMSAVITGARITIPQEFRTGGPRQIDPSAAELLAYAELG